MKAAKVAVDNPSKGKRKTAVAQVRLRPGKGVVSVNGRKLEDYFPRPTSRMIIAQPMEITGTTSSFDIVAKVNGGGISAQAAAMRHGISRALLLIQPEFRPALKKAGLLTRDAREVERKKYGRHKARKRPQYSKR
ncbi:MAG: 30S ribosomal protein S9 [Deltaproteobacteria bacterium]|jgi:small subunit ribosomal protein S9